jgi:hypothetical protein
MLRRLLAVLGALVVLLLPVSGAQAITYGQPDGTRHPNVGAMVAVVDGQPMWCSGTLIAPTVFLTAAHCTSYLQSLGVNSVLVTFDPDLVTATHFIPGVMHTNPGYNQTQSDPGDIAVVVFTKAVKKIAPAALPKEGLLDQLAAGPGLKGQKFTAVGYGANEPTLGGGPPSFEYLAIRQYATSTFSALNPAWLRLSQNDATGNGGGCYGDSGGPNFLGDSNTIASTTITGDAMCLAANVTYRLDTPSARAFLGQYVSLP